VLPRFLAAADSALLVELGDAVSDQASAAVLALDASIACTPPAGVVEVIPGLCSLLVEYDPLRTSNQRLRGDIEALLRSSLATTPPRAAREHLIAVGYDEDDAPDLAAVAQATGLPRDEVVRLHVAPSYRVAMLGNLPGLPYLLGLDARLDVPRHDDPRDAVPPGSVAIAGLLACVYPSAGPGGWNIIGRTDTMLFDPQRTPPALLAPGDTVRFVAAQGASVQRLEPKAPPEPAAARSDARPSLLVVQPGLITSVQDAGRHGHQRAGVPRCGALDAELLRVANLLAGNHANTAALEVTHTGPVLEVRAPSVRIAVAGDCEVVRISSDGTHIPVPPWRSMVLRDGERLRVGRVRDGLRCIVAIEGGIAVTPVLGSRSTYLRGGFGGLHGRALLQGDTLPLQREYAGHHPDVRLEPSAVRDAGFATEHITAVHAVAGPQDGAVDAASLHELFASELTVAPRSDRVGLRLDGLRLRHRGAGEIVSDGCAAGSVQVPGSGQPIVLLADRGTTGGYPKVATIASVDLPRLARLRPGARVHLQPATSADAEAMRRRREARLATLADALEPVSGV
jgi:KipI family sensor histidine kinase inhibitor